MLQKICVAREKISYSDFMKNIILIKNHVCMSRVERTAKVLRKSGATSVRARDQTILSEIWNEGPENERKLNSSNSNAKTNKEKKTPHRKIGSMFVVRVDNLNFHDLR